MSTRERMESQSGSGWAGTYGNLVYSIRATVDREARESQYDTIIERRASIESGMRQGMRLRMRRGKDMAKDSRPNLRSCANARA